MTQMGLDYQKHLETVRHNQATEAENVRTNIANEGIRQQTADASTMDAQTRQYTASFEPRRVAATESQAQSAARNAASNERNAASNERNAASNAAQAEAAKLKADLDALYRGYEARTSRIAANARADRNEVAREANALKDQELRNKASGLLGHVNQYAQSYGYTPYISELLGTLNYLTDALDLDIG